jgi:hypothetical protein
MPVNYRHEHGCVSARHRSRGAALLLLSPVVLRGCRSTVQTDGPSRA